MGFLGRVQSRLVFWAIVNCFLLYTVVGKMFVALSATGLLRNILLCRHNQWLSRLRLREVCFRRLVILLGNWSMTIYSFVTIVVLWLLNTVTDALLGNTRTPRPSNVAHKRH